MPVAEVPPSLLYEHSPGEPAQQLEGSWSSAWAKRQASEQAEAGPEAQTPLERTQALLYGALAVKEAQASCLAELKEVAREGYAVFLAQLHQLLAPHYPLLQDGVRSTALALLREGVQKEASGAQALCLALLRHIVSGSMEAGNVWLACTMVDLLRSHFEWLGRHPPLAQAALFALLRLMPEAARGGSNAVEALKQYGTTLCCRLLTERWEECRGAGRDLVRLLQDVGMMAEFKGVWQDLLAGRAPSAEEPSSSGRESGSLPALEQLLASRTPKELLLSRLTPDMESQMHFILTQVRMGNQKRYQQWFTTKHLSGPHADALIPDIVRYIVGVVHPPNHVLSSDIIPRWAVLGWLMQCPRSRTGEANARLALMYDWLFFNPTSDSIMNIEPAMLLMVHSIPKYASMTNALLEFLFLAVEHYAPPLQPLIQKGISASVEHLVTRGVVKSLEHLAKSEDVAPTLRRQLTAMFPAFCIPQKPRPPAGRPPGLAGKPLSPIATPRTQQPESPRAATPRTGDANAEGAQQPGSPSSPRAHPQLYVSPESGLTSLGEEELAAAAEQLRLRKRQRLADQADGSPSDASLQSHQEEDASSVPHAALAVVLEELSAAVALPQQGTAPADASGGHEELVPLMSRLLAALAAVEEAEKQDAGRPGTKRKRSLPPTPEPKRPSGMQAAVQALTRIAETAPSSGSGMSWFAGNSSNTLEPPAGVGAALFDALMALERPPAQQVGSRLLGALRQHAVAATTGAHLLRYACASAASAPTPQLPLQSNPHQNGMPAHTRDSLAFRCYSNHLRVAADMASGQGDASTSGSDPDPETPASLFLADLRTSLAAGLGAFRAMVPLLLQHLPHLTAGSPDALHLFIAVADAPLLLRLMCDVASRRYPCCLPLSLATAQSSGSGEIIDNGVKGAKKSAVSRPYGKRSEANNNQHNAGTLELVALVLRSQQWDGHCQQALWQLLPAELVAAGRGLAEQAAVQLMAALAQPGNAASAELSAGLLALMRSLEPAEQLVQAVLQLPSGLSGLAAAALCAWTSPVEDGKPGSNGGRDKAHARQGRNLALQALELWRRHSLQCGASAVGCAHEEQEEGGQLAGAKGRTDQIYALWHAQSLLPSQQKDLATLK